MGASRPRLLLLPVALLVCAALGGVYEGKRNQTPETQKVIVPRSTEWQKIMAKRCFSGDVSACDAVKATRADVR